MPNCLAAAAKLGIRIPVEVGFEIRGIRFHCAERSVEADFPASRGLGVRRTALHRILLETAERAGVELRWGAPVSDFDNIDARWIVGADGTSSRVRRWAGLDSYVHNTHRFTYRQHYEVAPWTDHVEVHWAEGCQIYITPTDSNEVGVALISRDQRLRVDEAVRRFPALSARLKAQGPPDMTCACSSKTVPVTSRGRGAITAMMRLHKVTRGNVALIGDASGSVDAITGEGLCLAFKQAAPLADGMARGDLSEYALLHPRLALRPTMMAHIMMLLDTGPRMRGLGFGALTAAPWMFEKLLQVHVS